MLTTQVTEKMTPRTESAKKNVITMASAGLARVLRLCGFAVEEATGIRLIELLECSPTTPCLQVAGAAGGGEKEVLQQTMNDTSSNNATSGKCI
jgi:hypothetical protein